MLPKADGKPINRQRFTSDIDTGYSAEILTHPVVWPRRREVAADAPADPARKKGDRSENDPWAVEDGRLSNSTSWRFTAGRRSARSVSPSITTPAAGPVFHQSEPYWPGVSDRRRQIESFELCISHRPMKPPIVLLCAFASLRKSLARRVRRRKRLDRAAAIRTTNCVVRCHLKTYCRKDAKTLKNTKMHLDLPRSRYLFGRLQFEVDEFQIAYCPEPYSKCAEWVIVQPDRRSHSEIKVSVRLASRQN